MMSVSDWAGAVSDWRAALDGKKAGLHLPLSGLNSGHLPESLSMGSCPGQNARRIGCWLRKLAWRGLRVRTH